MYRKTNKNTSVVCFSTSAGYCWHIWAAVLLIVFILFFWSGLFRLSLNSAGTLAGRLRYSLNAYGVEKLCSIPPPCGASCHWWKMAARSSSSKLIENWKKEPTFKPRGHLWTFSNREHDNSGKPRHWECLAGCQPKRKSTVLVRKKTSTLHR